MSSSRIRTGNTDATETIPLIRRFDVLWGGDIRAFHPPASRFDAVIGGPLCSFCRVEPKEAIG
jgi:hypothetical protein